MRADVWNPQDAWMQLAEDVRIGLVGRPVPLQPRGIKFVAHKVNIDLDIPVFDWGEDSALIDLDLLDAANRTILDDSFALPFERFAMLTSIPAHHLCLQYAPLDMQHLRHTYCIVVQQVADDVIEFHPFSLNSDMRHWARQVFEVQLNLRGPDSAMNCQAINDGFPDEFFANIQHSLQERINSVLTQIHRLVRGQGRVTQASATPAFAAAVTKRRAQAATVQPSIQTVRIVDLSSLSIDRDPNQATGTGPTISFRRGTWVREHQRAGRTIAAHPRRGTQVRRGGAAPWYEIKE